MYRIVEKVKSIYRIWQQQGLGGICYRIDRLFLSPECVDGYVKPSAPELHQYESLTENFQYTPKISVLMPVYNTDRSLLREAIESVRDQIYQHWELCIADDASSDDGVREILSEYATLDDRIKIVFRESNGHISQASNSALTLATGEYVALFDHDDILTPHALACVVQELQDDEKPQILYSDEAKIDLNGSISEPTRKPAWLKYYFCSYMYTGHLTVYEKTLIDEAGGFRSEYDGSQDYDLMLRAIARTDRIARIPKVLYYWRTSPGSVAGDRYAKSYAYQSAAASLAENLAHTEPNLLRIESTIYPGVTRARYRMPERKSIKIKPFLRDKVIDLDESYEEDYILFLDAHYKQLTGHWSDLMIEHMQAKDVAAVVPLFVDKERKRVKAAGYHIEKGALYPYFQGASVYEASRGMQLVTGREVEAASFGCVMIKAGCWTEFCRSLDCQQMAVSDLEVRFSLFLKNNKKSIYFSPYIRFACP